MKNLDLYAKIEPMIGFYEAYENLYTRYLQILQKFDIKTILDVGCGNGKLLQHLQHSYEAEGIDLSAKMVNIATKRGMKAKHCYLHEVVAKYDALLAVADVLNYMDHTTLQKFLHDVEDRLHLGGYFICDINTLHGFEDVAAGSMNADFGETFLAVDASYDDEVLETHFTLFEGVEHCYKKEEETILQYYHTVSKIDEMSSLELIDIQDISLFSDKSDKTILIFHKAKF